MYVFAILPCRNAARRVDLLPDNLRCHGSASISVMSL